MLKGYDSGKPNRLPGYRELFVLDSLGNLNSKCPQKKASNIKMGAFFCDLFPANELLPSFS